jgi:hypothetical protein
MDPSQEAGFSSAGIEPLGGLALIIGEFVGFGLRCLTFRLSAANNAA